MAKKKIRVDMRKNRSKPPRDKQWTKEFAAHGFDEAAPISDERIRSKGELSRKRTVVQDDSLPAAGERLLRGRIIRVHGLQSVIETDDGVAYRCAVRRILKTMVTESRGAVATGDIVWFRPAGSEGMIERVEPRRGVLTRASRKKEQVLVANVDQVVIVISLVEPLLKPHLIDRYLASAGSGGIRPILCLNKVDLIAPYLIQPLVGSFSQLGVTTILTSAVTGAGIAALQKLLANRESVFAGQSGVGKSSVLNAVEPGLSLRVRAVSGVTQKGRHTTTTAEMVRLKSGGWVVDTPGVRTLQLFAIKPGEVEGFFPEFHPFVPSCGFPNCTHIHEGRCAIKRAVARRLISFRRYASYLGMFEGAMEATAENRE